ncbi:MAG: hypothetical protein R3F60_18720 [bacterium]
MHARRRPGLRGGALPADLAGHYDEASDCEPGEGGSTFGGGYSQCFRKADGSAWRLWNTGCGWEVGRREAEGAATMWAVYARTYAGRCENVPADQLSAAILGTGPLLDAAGNAIAGLTSTYCPTAAPVPARRLRGGRRRGPGPRALGLLRRVLRLHAG